MAAPPVVRPGAPEVAGALVAGAVVALPAVGGYRLVVRAGSPEGERQLGSLAARAGGAGEARAGETHFWVGDAGAVRQLTEAWSDELAALLARCWPGPVEVSVCHGSDTVIVGVPDGRALRKLCRRLGPWRTLALGPGEAAAVAAAFTSAEVACVVDGGPRRGASPTVVDATATPLCVLREGALPASFIEGTMLMSRRRRFFGRHRRT